MVKVEGPCRILTKSMPKMRENSRNLARPAMVARERVAVRLGEAARHPVTLVMAAAGYGKSTALQQYLEGCSEPLLRFDVRAEHANLSAFVRGLAEAVASVAPFAAGSALEALQAAGSTAEPVAALATWMVGHLGTFEGIVVIDDFHHAADDAACAALVAALIERTKHAIRWMIASRSAGRLPVSSWIVYGEAGIPVNEHDLAMTIEEAHAAIAASGARVEDADVVSLLGGTAGWITGFMLALGAAQGGRIDFSTAARERSYDYLAEQVLSSLRPQQQMLLLAASALSTIDAGVLQRAGFPDARAALADLHKRVAFLAADNSDATAASPVRYRCHDLFRDFLERQLDLQGEARAREVRTRIARALAACGYHVEALRLLVRTGALDDVVDLLQTHGFELHRMGRADIVRDAVARLAETPLYDHPIVLGLRAHDDALAGRYDRSLATYERALAGTEDALLVATFVTRMSYAALDSGREPPARLEELAGWRELPAALRGELLCALAFARAHRGQLDGYGALLDEIETVASATSVDPSSMLVRKLGLAALCVGEERTVRTLRQAAERARGEHRFRTAALAYVNLASHCLGNLGDVIAAKEYIALAAEQAALSGDTYVWSVVMHSNVESARFEGDSERLAELLAAYDACFGNGERKEVAAARAMLHAWDGDFRTAYSLCPGVWDSLQVDRLIWHGWAAIFAAGAGLAEEAQVAIRTALREAEHPESLPSSFDRAVEMARSLCALAALASGRSALAARLIRKAPAIETPLTDALRGLVTVLVRESLEGVDAAELEPYVIALRRYQYGGIVRIVEALLARAAAARNYAALTPAEIAVLRSLAAGNAPRAIAVSTGCSVNTVRSHVRSIIAKFDCSGTERAIRIARQRGLL
jgi:LuxR family maltose regulon positive regulatory protein